MPACNILLAALPAEVVKISFKPLSINITQMDLAK